MVAWLRLPVLRISAAPFLTAGLQRVLGAISARQRELAAARKQRNVGNIDFHFADARRFWLLHTLNAAIPILSHLLDVKAHPEEAYLALCGLADLATVYPYQGILFLFAAAALAVAFVLLQQGTVPLEMRLGGVTAFAGQSGVVQLRMLEELRDAGILTPEEFTAKRVLIAL